MHKIYKSYGNFSLDGTVNIDNTVLEKEVNKETEQPKLDISELEKLQIEDYIENRFEARIKELKDDFELQQRKALEEIETTKGKVLFFANKNAEKIAEDARIQASILKDNSKKEGYADGYEKGKAEAYSQFNDRLNAIETILNEVQKSKLMLYDKNENELLDLVFSLVEKITYAEIRSEKNVIFDIVKQALKTFRTSEYVKISIANTNISKDIQFDVEFVKKLAGNIPEIEIEILNDAPEGTIILDNKSEIIDASIPTQLGLLSEIINQNRLSGQYNDEES